MSTIELIVLVGGVITSILVIYSGVLAFKLKQKEHRKSQPVEFQPKSQSQLDAKQSVRVIAQALLQNDLTPTEAAMRIGFLAQKFSPTASQAQSIQAFQSLAMDTSHLPILEAWKTLPTAEKKKLEKERLSIEKTHSVAIDAAANTLAKPV